MAEQTKTGFRPVQGEEESILNTPYSEGWVYFATDSGKIFLDANNERIVMGGSGSSLYYANSLNVIENPEGTYTLAYDTLDDDSASPKENDLIINVPNGCFYRVLSADEESGIECTLLAVSGTGGGGGTGGGDSGGTGSGSAIVLELVDSSFPTTFVHKQDAFVNFKATASDDVLINVAVKVVGSSSATYNYTFYSGEEFALNIGQLLFTGTNKITITASGENSGTSSKSYSNRNCITLGLQKNASFNPLQVFEGACTFSCIPVGAGLEKTIKVFVDNLLSASAVIPPTISNRNYTIDIPAQSHGAHNVEIVLSTVANGIEMKTDSLMYELAWKEAGNPSPIIWIPEGYVSSIVNYTNAGVNYMVYDPNNETTEVRFYRESLELPTSPQSLTYSSTKYLRWDLTDYEVGSNTYTISAGSSSKTFVLTVAEDTSRNMNILTSGLALNLDSTGRSNNENETSRKTWTYKNADGITTAVTFNNFNWYNNGWINDEDGRTCLRISNGASISIPVAPLNILNSTALGSPIAFEFRFKVRNVNEYATLIQRGQDADATDNITGFETERGVFGKLFSACGICLGTQEAFFKGSNASVSARYKEDEVLNLTFVLESRTANNTYPLIYIYLNGVMSGITTYTASESFESNATQLIFNSDYCDVDLYKVRIYKANLSSADVVHNYIADVKDVNEYDMNQIITYDDKTLPHVDFDLMLEYNVQHPSAPIMPYAIVKSHADDDMLPYVKGGKKPVSVKFVNPTLDYLYENELITGEQYLHGCPSFEFTSAEKSCDVQGTSSQGYPRRNFKLKFKQDDANWTYTNGPLAGAQILDKNEYNGKEYSKWYMDSEVGESTFCWKADYMDSSRCHNSGYASYVSTLYSKHPLEDYGIDASKYRTTIYGFPMIVFQEKKDGTIEFVGMYNFNLDKGSTDSLGLSVKEPSKVEGKTIKEIAECWEFCNNQGARCSFQTLNFTETTDKYEEIALSATTYEAGVYYTTEDEKVFTLCQDEYDAEATYYKKVVGPLAMLSDFEYRYHVDKDDIDDCLDGKKGFLTYTQEQRNEFLLSKYANFFELCEWINSTKDDLNKFKTEFTQHFDSEYCFVYFIMTELLHLYDSRGKNMMMATYGPQVEGGNYIWYPIFYDIDTQLGINNSGVPTWEYYAEPTDGNMFSTSNSILWNNLWAAFSEDIKAKYIEMRKANLTIEHLDGYYTFNPEISGSYAMMGKRPIVLHNLDEYYKYIAPTFSGFINTSGELTRDTGSFFYCLQGTRQLLRYLYLRNRLNYVDSKWIGGKYATEAAKNEFWSRIDGSNGAQTSDKFLYNPEKAGTTFTDEAGTEFLYTDTYPMPLDAIPNFNVRSFLRQYIHGQYDDKHTTPIPCDGKESVYIAAPSDFQENFKTEPALTQQLVYFGGGEYIADMGDLGLNYLDELHIPTLKRIESLKVGSDVEGYHNNQLTYMDLSANAKNADGTVNANAKTLLKEIVLTGLTSLGGEIDVSGSEKLETLRALRTKISSVTFADGVQIKTLHLPETITVLSLIEPTSLTGTVVSPTTADGKFAEGLYIEGLTDLVGTAVSADAKSRINTLSIIGGNMGYGSYKLLETLVNVKVAMQAKNTVADGYSKQLSINLENVDWSPYKVVEYGEPYITSTGYFYDNGRYKFTPYVYVDNDKWEADTLNSRIYTFNSEEFTREQTTIADLSVLDTFINSYENAVNEFHLTGSKELNYFRNTSTTATVPTLPTLTGLIFVENTGNPYEEADIQNKYLAAFPGLTIFCREITEGYTATFVSVTDGKEAVVEIQRYKKTDENAKPVKPLVPPSKLNYSFLGWSATPDGAILSSEDFEALEFSAEQSEYKFYAVYKVTGYKIRFYNADQETTLLFEDTVNYGQYLKAPAILPSIDESQLPETQRYKFAGWVTDPDTCIQKSATAAANVVVNLERIMSQNMDRNFFACYYTEDVYMSATEEKYFEFNPATYSDSYNTNYNIVGYAISPAPGYKLAGKITLPTSYKGQPIISVDGFTDQTEITHIFWINTPTALRRINNKAFSGCTKLKKFEFPPSVRTIVQGAFMNCSNLEIFDFSNHKLLSHIGRQAFNAAFKTDTPTELFVIPGSVIEIDALAFSYMDGITGGIKTLQLGLPGEATQLISVKDKAFAQNTHIAPIQNVRIYALDPSNLNEGLSDALYGAQPSIPFTGSIEILQA